jgi:ABC-type phosphate transport system permease subunit
MVDFLTDTQWTPLFDDAHFGIMVLISGTLVSSLPWRCSWRFRWGRSSPSTSPNLPTRKVREVAKPVLELLGGIPTIVFGYFALLVVTPDPAVLLSLIAWFLAAVGGSGDGHHDRPLYRFALRRCHAGGADEHA